MSCIYFVSKENRDHKPNTIECAQVRHRTCHIWSYLLLCSQKGTCNLHHLSISIYLFFTWTANTPIKLGGAQFDCTGQCTGFTVW